MNEHINYMHRVIELAEQALQKGNKPFGALLVSEGKIILEAENTTQSENDSTRHAELTLVSCASRQLPEEVLHKATLYTSTEPCAMCAGAIYWAGITKVVYACSQKTFQQLSGLNIDMDCRNIFDSCHPIVEVVGPVEEELACEQLMRYWPHPS